jgi:hypothetical protein
LSFTDPYFLDLDMSAGFDIFRTRRNLQREAGYDAISTGVVLRNGYRLGEYLSQGLNYTFRNDDITQIDAFASSIVLDAASQAADAVAVGAPRVAAGAGRADREHAVGREHGVARHDLRAGFAIGIVGEARGAARAALDENLDPAGQRGAGLLQGRDGGRHEGHAALPGECLFRDGNLHGGTACGRRNERLKRRGMAASVIRGTEAGNTAAGCQVSGAERRVFSLRRVASWPLAGVSGHW